MNTIFQSLLVLLDLGNELQVYRLQCRRSHRYSIAPDLDRAIELKRELETFLREKHFVLDQKFQDETWVLHFSYLCDMMTALNMLNKSRQGGCRTMIDFAKYVLSKKSWNCGMSKWNTKSLLPLKF